MDSCLTDQARDDCLRSLSYIDNEPPQMAQSSGIDKAGYAHFSTNGLSDSGNYAVFPADHQFLQQQTLQYDSSPQIQMPVGGSAYISSQYSATWSVGHGNGHMELSNNWQHQHPQQSPLTNQQSMQDHMMQFSTQANARYTVAPSQNDSGPSTPFHRSISISGPIAPTVPPNVEYGALSHPTHYHAQLQPETQQSPMGAIPNHAIYADLALAARDRTWSSASYNSLHSDIASQSCQGYSTGFNHPQCPSNRIIYPIEQPSKLAYTDPDFALLNTSQPLQYQPQTSSSSLHRSASAGNMLSQQYQQIAQQEFVSTPRHRGSISALPTASGFPQYMPTSSRPSVARSSSYASPSATRPALSLYTDEGTLGNGWAVPTGPEKGGAMQRSISAVSRQPELVFHTDQSPHVLSSISQHTNASLQSHFSDSTTHTSLRPESAVADPYGSSRDMYDFRESSYSGPSIDSRRESVTADSSMQQQQQQYLHQSAGMPCNSENSYDRYTTHSVASSIPSTPELSRQQSTSSFRSPATDYSQLHGSLPPPSHPLHATTTSHAKAEKDDQPIPELSSIHLKEKTAHLDTWARLPSRPDNDAEANAQLKPHVKAYLDTPNKLLLGERTVIVLSTSVAQKSYGSERRFLVPQPSAMFLGVSWWTHLPDPYVPERKPGHGMTQALQLFAPTLQIAMAHDKNPSESSSSIEWTTYTGDAAHSVASAEDFPIAGRIVGEKLHIPDTKDDKADKHDKDKSAVQALVSVISPGYGALQDRTIGTFASKPVKVISKPSKKDYVYHGATVSLCNRLRSQATTTRYLCVSSAAASFPTWDWQAMSGQEEKPFASESSYFEARTSAWGAFVIYAVDPRRPLGLEAGHEPLPASNGLPAPPPNVLPMPHGGAALPIHYNQPILLQCIATGVISPVMIIRRVDNAVQALGGGTTNANVARPIFDLPSAPGEPLGDVVLQLHKIALEVMPDAEAAYTNPVDPELGFVSGGSYLCCCNEQVGHQKAKSNRISLSAMTPNQTQDSPIVSHKKSAGNVAENKSASSQCMALANRNRSQSLAVDSSRDHLTMSSSNDGGKVKKLRRATSSLSNPIGRLSTCGRGRGLSSTSNSNETSEELSLEGVWRQDAGEAGIWTIASTEIVRHTFYIPPILFDGLTPYRCKASGCPDAFLTPIPSVPLSSMPVVRKYIISTIAPGSNQARRMGVNREQCRMVTLYGDNLGSEWTVWFGDTPSPSRAESACTEILECLEPAGEDLPSAGPLHILLVRKDGVTVPSYVYWSR